MPGRLSIAARGTRPDSASVTHSSGTGSWSPSPNRGVKIDTTALTNDTTLTWTPGTGTGTATSYEILWRPTIEPLWQRVIPVGAARTATIDLS